MKLFSRWSAQSNYFRCNDCESCFKEDKPWWVIGIVLPLSNITEAGLVWLSKMCNWSIEEVKWCIIPLSIYQEFTTNEESVTGVRNACGEIDWSWGNIITLE